jgi:mannose-6-phosphate isomerase-like protein (cupin superfamily)
MTNYKGYHGDIEALTVANTNFREVIYTAPYSQLVLMSLKPGEDIGEEVHGGDQFFRFEAGTGKVVLGGVEQAVKDGDAVVVPASLRHNVVNTSLTEALKLYTIYSPAHHKVGTVHATKEQALADKEEFDGLTTE